MQAVNAVVAFLFAATGPVTVILAVRARGGLAECDIASWIFAAFFLNGLISILFSLLCPGVLLEHPGRGVGRAGARAPRVSRGSFGNAANRATMYRICNAAQVVP